MSAFRTVLTGVRLAAAVAAAAQLVRAARVAPPMRPTVTPERSVTGGITVVVPARDEATRIGPLLRRVVGAPGVDEVVVVDDGSTDGTATLAAAAGARVVTGSEPPSGWTGKAWALQQGIESVVTRWVVALDADTRPSPDLPQAAVARALADDADLLTLAGEFECPTAGLRWLHPALLTTLVYRYGPPGVGGRPERAIANGQCTVLRRDRFLELGGMQPVADQVVEDVALARHVAAAGGCVEFLDATGLLTVRMYESADDAVRGWGRSLALPGVEPPWRQVVGLGVVVVAQALPLPRLIAGRGDAIDVGLAAMRLGTLVGTARAYRDRGAAYWASPLADPVAAAVLAWGTFTRRRTWKGRVYATMPPARSGSR